MLSDEKKGDEEQEMRQAHDPKFPLAAQQGKQILHVRANSDEDVNKISALMLRYHAHAIKFFSPWSVADIPPQSIPGH